MRYVMDSNDPINYHDLDNIVPSKRHTNLSIIQNGEGNSSSSQYGLTTKEALIRLHDEIETEVNLMKCKFSNRNTLSWLRESISFRSELSKMRWPSVLFMIAQAIAHFIVALLGIDDPATDWVGFQGLILGALLAANLTVNLWDTKLRYKELLMKAERILLLIKRCSEDEHLLKNWKQYNLDSSEAKALFAPKSPSIHQTVTYRDESCLNLPDYLLVKGDIIHLYPGEKAPGDCISIRVKDNSKNGSKARAISLSEGQVFHCIQKEKVENVQGAEDPIHWSLSKKNPKNLILQFSHAKLKKATKGIDFQMLSTPYINSLRISLQRSHKRPVNSVEKECFIVSRKYFETFVIPCLFILSTIVTAVHYGYLDLAGIDQKINTISIAYLLLRPSLTIMPFLPWMFPCFWLIVNAYGNAKLLCHAEAQRKRARQTNQKESNQDHSPEWTLRDHINCATGAAVPKFENLLATPTVGRSSENKNGEDELNIIHSEIKFSFLFKIFIDLIKCKSGHVWRSSNLLQVLGCLTSLCCIDKNGILSWSNPTPEKVFVMTKNNEDELKPVASQLVNIDETDSQYPVDEPTIIRNSTATNQDTLDIKAYNTMFEDDQISNNQMSVAIKQQTNSKLRPEILDISHSLNCYRSHSIVNATFQQRNHLQFDEINWSKFMSNLKPLGLAIHMNNCCQQSFGEYFRFYKHITYESVLQCNLTPVVKRRCICGLSKLIGFSKDVVKSYKYLNQIGIYKLIDPSSINKGKLVSSLENTSRLKLPFPNMICNVHQDAETGNLQVFSQGTADIILDTCIEFWDGSQLNALDDASRKKIMDFYHRTSLTSYCSAFSYTPLLTNHRLDDRYIELPPENSRFAPHLKRLTNEYQEEFLQKQVINLPSNMKTHHGMKSHLDNTELNSIDYLTLGRHLRKLDKQSGIEPMANMVTRRHLSVENLNECSKGTNESETIDSGGGCTKKSRKLIDTLDELTDQVFVGMVSLQYQAYTDFVALVEQLEHACIRFVHFSKENELRSRVFSEKMGLESGWNCHISLQSDQNLDRIEDHEMATLPKTFNGGIADELATKFPNERISSLLGDKNPSNCNSNTSQDDESSIEPSISSDGRTLHSWKSLPSLIMQLAAKVTKVKHHQSTPDHNKVIIRETGLEQLANSSNFVPATASDCGDDLIREPDKDPIEGSGKDEGFQSIAFDMSNRAKLPKGIENIRPHLETVDNVPLQVSLFTDCTPDLMKQMIEIMQEYGEIVCVIGSSLSKFNTSIFLQANASIAIEPIVPQSCSRINGRARKMIKREKRKLKKRKSKSLKRKQKGERYEYTAINMNPRPTNPRDRLGIGPVEPSNKTSRAQIRPQSSSSSSSDSSESGSSSFSSSDDQSDFEFGDNYHAEINESSKSLIQEVPDPCSLASKLASLPCSYSYNRMDHINLYSLIMEARHFTFKMKNTFVCMICFALSISSAQFLASILFLPPMLSSGLTIWLTVVIVPIMSFALMSTTIDSQVMKVAVGKNLQLKPENIAFFVLCYLIKFIPSIIVVVLSFGSIIAHSCKLTGFGSSSFGPCWMFTYVHHGNSTSTDTGTEDLLWSTHLLTAQVSAAFLIVLYFVIISSGFVHRSHLLWERSPFTNHYWVSTSIAIILCQFLYNHLVLQVSLSSLKVPYEFLCSLPLHIWIISLVSPVIVIGINLLVKRAEIKATIRQQRRARFDFNTKLGMNSPF